LKQRSAHEERREDLDSAPNLLSRSNAGELMHIEQAMSFGLAMQKGCQKTKKTGARGSATAGASRTPACYR
jgi:hypothetical protein